MASLRPGRPTQHTKASIIVPQSGATVIDVAPDRALYLSQEEAANSEGTRLYEKSVSGSEVRAPDQGSMDTSEDYEKKIAIEPGELIMLPRHQPGGDAEQTSLVNYYRQETGDNNIKVTTTSSFLNRLPGETRAEARARHERAHICLGVGLSPGSKDDASRLGTAQINGVLTANHTAHVPVFAGQLAVPRLADPERLSKDSAQPSHQDGTRTVWRFEPIADLSKRDVRHIPAVRVAMTALREALAVPENRDNVDRATRAATATLVEKGYHATDLAAWYRTLRVSIAMGRFLRNEPALGAAGEAAAVVAALAVILDNDRLDQFGDYWQVLHNGLRDSTMGADGGLVVMALRSAGTGFTAQWNPLRAY